MLARFCSSTRYNEEFFFIIRKKIETTTLVVFSHIGFPPKLWCPYVIDVLMCSTTLHLILLMIY